MDIFLQYKLLEWSGYQLTVGKMAGVAATFVFMWLVLSVVRRLLNSGIKRGRWDSGRGHSLFLIVQYLLWLLAAMATLKVLGIDISVLLAGSAAVLVGITLGLQQIFRDIASGVFILFEGTIEIGDVLLVDGVLGRVIEINLRTSKIRTTDGMTVIVPNNKFIIEKVNNWSDQGGKPSRFSINVTIANTCDENVIAQWLLDCARAHKDVVNDDEKRQSAVRLIDFNKTDLQFELQFWTLLKFEVDTVRSDLRFAIRERFRMEGIQGGEPVDVAKPQLQPGNENPKEEE